MAQLWEITKPFGRPPAFNNPAELWDAATKYFQWCIDNPLMEAKAFAFQGNSWIEELPKMRAMTIQGLCLHMNISQETLSNYEQRDDFFGVVKQIKETIYEQKFSGAAADLLNSNIIARDLGLADKKDHQSSDGSMTPKSYSPEQYKAAEDAISSKMDDLD